MDEACRLGGWPVPLASAGPARIRRRAIQAGCDVELGLRLRQLSAVHLGRDAQPVPVNARRLAKGIGQVHGQRVAGVRLDGGAGHLPVEPIARHNAARRRLPLGLSGLKPYVHHLPGACDIRTDRSPSVRPSGSVPARTAAPGGGTKVPIVRQGFSASARVYRPLLATERGLALCLLREPRQRHNFPARLMLPASPLTLRLRHGTPRVSTERTVDRYRITGNRAH
jgi:hypothetical protein